MAMPAMQPPDSPTSPRVDEIEFHSLYAKSAYPVETQDGWELSVTRYQPTPQRFHQPLLGEPLLLLHGFSQNRHAWTSGEFVKNLLFFGMDIHILELRGHGKSSIALQRERSQRLGVPVPKRIDYGWDIDSYFLDDFPAGIAAGKRTPQRAKIFFLLHFLTVILSC